jgi:Flp pilus assembly protein TadD
MIMPGTFRLLLTLLFVAVFAAGCSKQAKTARQQNTNHTAIRNLAEIYYVNESYSRAASLLNMAGKLDPSDAESRGKLARLMLLSGSLKEARSEAEAVLETSSGSQSFVKRPAINRFFTWLQE